jgi:hypothetical protein
VVSSVPACAAEQRPLVALLRIRAADREDRSRAPARESREEGEAAVPRGRRARRGVFPAVPPFSPSSSRRPPSSPSSLIAAPLPSYAAPGRLGSDPRARRGRRGRPAGECEPPRARSSAEGRGAHAGQRRALRFGARPPPSARVVRIFFRSLRWWPVRLQSPSVRRRGGRVAPPGPACPSARRAHSSPTLSPPRGKSNLSLPRKNAILCEQVCVMTHKRGRGNNGGVLIAVNARTPTTTFAQSLFFACTRISERRFIQSIIHVHVRVPMNAKNTTEKGPRTPKDLVKSARARIEYSLDFSTAQTYEQKDRKTQMTRRDARGWRWSRREAGLLPYPALRLQHFSPLEYR